VTEDEAKAVAAVAARCLTWSGWRRWEPVMRYGRLFTPGVGTHAVDAWGMSPDSAGRKACRLAVDSDLLYAEGYAGYPRAGGVSSPWAWAWCLDGESVVDPAANRQGTAFFGVALRPQYMRRVRAAQRGDDGSEGFRWALTRGDREIPPLDPAADIALDLGRDIPSSVREWALTAERHQGPARMPPDWVLAELLGTADAGPAVQDRFRGLFVRSVGPRRTPGPVPSGPYARFLVRSADWFSSGMALQCAGKTGGAFSDDGEILGMIQEGDSVATLMRMADEHRPQCEWETTVAGKEAEKLAYTPAEARLQSAGRTFAVLRRLDYNVWDAWLRPPAPDGDAAGVRLTRNGVSYEMAFAAVFRAMGTAMPTEFTTVYAGEQPDPTPYPAFVPTPELWAQPESRLPMSYERHIIRNGNTLFETGQTGGTHSRDGNPLGGVGDGASLAALIQVADEKRPVSEWTLCPEDERRDPELTVQKNAEVDFCWDVGGGEYFAALHRLADGTWDAWLTPSHVPVAGRQEPTELLTPRGVSYELALAAIFRTMGEDMPAGFGLNYLDARITPGLPGPAQA
jgi:hypothetical protein